MNKTFYIALLAAGALSLSACGERKDTTEETTPPMESTVPAEEPKAGEDHEMMELTKPEDKAVEDSMKEMTPPEEKSDEEHTAE